MMRGPSPFRVEVDGVPVAERRVTLADAREWLGRLGLHKPEMRSGRQWGKTNGLPDPMTFAAQVLAVDVRRRLGYPRTCAVEFVVVDRNGEQECALPEGVDVALLVAVHHEARKQALYCHAHGLLLPWPGNVDVAVVVACTDTLEDIRTAFMLAGCDAVRIMCGPVWGSVALTDTPVSLP